MKEGEIIKIGTKVYVTPYEILERGIPLEGRINNYIRVPKTNELIYMVEINKDISRYAPDFVWTNKYNALGYIEFRRKSLFFTQFNQNQNIFFIYTIKKPNDDELKYHAVNGTITEVLDDTHYLINSKYGESEVPAKFIFENEFAAKLKENQLNHIDNFYNIN